MLEYENQMFLDILHEDGLIISAKLVLVYVYKMIRN